MNDNAPIHTGRRNENGENYIDKCRQHNVEPITNWPPNSPGN